MQSNSHKPIGKWARERAFDALNLALGAFLFLAPWIFDFSSDAAKQDAWYMGALIALVAIMELADFEAWAEWVNLAVGAWVMGAAWILGFYGRTTAMLIHLIVGFVVVISAGMELYGVHRDQIRCRWIGRHNLRARH